MAEFGLGQVFIPDFQVGLNEANRIRAAQEAARMQYISEIGRAQITARTQQSHSAAQQAAIERDLQLRRDQEFRYENEGKRSDSYNALRAMYFKNDDPPTPSEWAAAKVRFGASLTDSEKSQLDSEWKIQRSMVHRAGRAAQATVEGLNVALDELAKIKDPLKYNQQKALIDAELDRVKGIVRRDPTTGRVISMVPPMRLDPGEMFDVGAVPTTPSAPVPPAPAAPPARGGIGGFIDSITERFFPKSGTNPPSGSGSPAAPGVPSNQYLQLPPMVPDQMVPQPQPRSMMVPDGGFPGGGYSPALDLNPRMPSPVVPQMPQAPPMSQEMQFSPVVPQMPMFQALMGRMNANQPPVSFVPPPQPVLSYSSPTYPPAPQSFNVADSLEAYQQQQPQAPWRIPPWLYSPAFGQNGVFGPSGLAGRGVFGQQNMVPFVPNYISTDTPPRAYYPR